MRKHCAIASVLLTLTFLVAASESPAPQPADNDKDAAAAASPQNTPKEQMGYRQHLVAGKILDLRDIDVKAGDKVESHMLAKVKTFSGYTVVVDLGLRDQMPETVKVGDQIAAFGTVGRLNHKPLIVADKMAEIKTIPGREEIFESFPASYPSDNNKAGNDNDMKTQPAPQEKAQ